MGVCSAGMSFRDILRDLVEGVDGGVAALIMGLDGIAIDRYSKETSMLDVETVGMEFSVIITQIRKAAEMLEAGKAEEIVVQSENMITVIRLLNQECFVALTLGAQGLVGKAKYLLRTAAPKLLEMLG